MAESSSSRPRRSTRAPARGPETVTLAEALSSPSKKRKARNPEAQLEHLLTNSKSKLTTMDISEIMNYDTFLNLSAESQELLCSMLPPTAFFTYQPKLDPTHPAAEGRASDHDELMLERSPATLDPMFFTSPFLLSAAHTFQDHIFSGWMTNTAKEKVAKYERGIRDGSLHAEWKDEEWQREHPPPKRIGGLQAVDLDVVNLAQRDLLREGDVIAYRRHLPTLGITVMKDLLVRSVNIRSHTVSMLLAPGTTSALPQNLLIVGRGAPQPPILTMEDIMSSSELEGAILDVDGRVPRSERHILGAPPPASPHNTAEGVSAETLRASRAAKAMTVWRWRDEVLSDLEMQMSLERGGRDLLGTIFYLRRT